VSPVNKLNKSIRPCWTNCNTNPLRPIHHEETMIGHKTENGRESAKLLAVIVTRCRRLITAWQFVRPFNR
jgi:hypothetical protein